MQSLGFPSNWVVRPIIALLGFAISFYLGAGLILRYREVEIGISRAQKSDTDYAAGKETMLSRSLSETRAIDITLEKVSLDIIKRNAMSNKTSHLSILKPLTTTFQPGMLNVIMV